MCWFAAVRRLVRDPRAEVRRIAESRARSRLLHPFGGGDVDREFFALSDVTIAALDDASSPRTASFLMVARGHVRLVALAGEEAFAPH